MTNRNVAVPSAFPSLSRPRCGPALLHGLLVKGDESYGLIGHIVLGIVGAVVGGFIAGALTGGDYITGINVTTIVVAVIGAVIAVVVWNAITGRARTGRGAL